MGDGRLMARSDPWARVTFAWADGEPHCVYAKEILQHTGLLFQSVPTEELAAVCGRSEILIISGPPTDEDAVELLGQFVAAGRTLIVIGSVGPLGPLLGVKPEESAPDLGEGYLVPTGDHPLTGADTFPIHFFSGQTAQAVEATTVAAVWDRHGRPTGRTGISVYHGSGGTAIFIAPAIGATAVRIRQGCYVDTDGVSAPDGSADLADGVLRSEDGAVLDWHLDRSGGTEEEAPAFLHPPVDRLAAAVVRAAVYAAKRAGLALALMWYYPRNEPAAGIVSFYTDGTDPQNAVNILHQANLVGLRGTWCVSHPGYTPDMYRVLRKRGHEVAIQFEAPGPGSWEKERLKVQGTQICRTAGMREAASVLAGEGRWEGRNVFYEWCAELNYRAEIGRGPSKAGNVGFPFGTCHPFRPMRPDGTCYSAVSIPFIARDPGLTCSSARCLALVEAVASHYGVAHFNFGTQGFERPEVSAAFRNIVAHGRANGIDWMTAEEAASFERARRTVKAEFGTDNEELMMTLKAEAEMGEATLLISGEPLTSAAINGRAVPPHPVERYGFPFSSIVLDLRAGHTLILGLGRLKVERKAG
jgi:hypothetical protein